MVNDQLIRIHHMRLLSYDKMMTKQLEEQRASDVSAPNTQGSSSSPSSPTTQSKSLSTSAPETGLVGRRHSYIKQEQVAESVSLGGKRHKERQQDAESPFSKSQSFLPSMKNYAAGGKKFKGESNLEHSYNGCGGGGEIAPSNNNDKNQGSQVASIKKKSSWRHLLSPSYKSRSDEFHKFFADEIPGDERLIADYSCALHREILIQGRVYISINYIAFYSNLFSWITKLVVRLRDIADIYKANTARIIPNAIQIVTNSGDKHVFASFIARDKSYIMFWRIWRNNLLMERMTDEELRSLVHLSYGKDLGMSTDEELKINSPDPKTPANVAAPLAGQETSRDGNNNNNDSTKSETGHTESQAAPPVGGEDRRSSFVEEGTQRESCDESLPAERGRSRYNSRDYSTSNILSSNERLTYEQAQVMSELSHRLHHISAPNSAPLEQWEGEARGSTSSPWSELTGSPNTTSSSTVLVESPQVRSGDQIVPPEPSDGQSEGDMMGTRAAHFRNFFGRRSATTTTDGSESTLRDDSGELPPDGDTTMAQPERQQPLVMDKQELQLAEEREESSANSAADDEQSATGHLNAVCDCDSHDGLLVADEQFDIGVDTLFSLIFTNSKFMRAYMIQRGMTDAIVSKWRRSTNGASSSGEKSNSSTLSRSLDGGTGATNGPNNGRSRRNSIDSNIYLTQKPSVKSRQQRQLNYSMNINHVLAKQIQVEEKQNICSVKPGVYVLKSQSVNSGVPFSESFTVDLTYCMTRAGHGGRSRMLVHGGVNFIKDKHSWKLAMIKSVIEKQSVQGINEFVADLISRIREYIAKKRQQLATGANSADMDQVSLIHQDDQELYPSESQAGDSSSSAAPAQATSTGARQQRSQTYNKTQPAAAAAAAAATASATRSSRSLARAKSKLKERKLRNIYKYYIHASGATNQSEQPLGQSEKLLSRQHLDASDSDDSLDSSSLDADFDDNDSMIMMMTTHETDAGSQLGETDRFAGRAQSFSDLEWGQSMDDDDDDDAPDDRNERDRYRAHRPDERGSASEASNVTINNENIAANYRPQSPGRARKQTSRISGRQNAWIEGAADAEPVKLIQGHLSSGAPPCAARRGPVAAGSRTHPLGHQRARSSLYRKTAAAECSISSSSLRNRLFCKKNLVSFSLVVFALLLCALLAVHLVVLQRLSAIEAQLSTNCGNLRPPRQWARATD